MLQGTMIAYETNLHISHFFLIASTTTQIAQWKTCTDAVVHAVTLCRTESLFRNPGYFNIQFIPHPYKTIINGYADQPTPH